MICWGGHILQANFLEDFTYTGLHLEKQAKDPFCRPVSSFSHFI